MKRILLFTAGLMMAVSTQKAMAQASYLSLGPVAGFGHSWTSNMVNGEFKPSVQLGVGMIYSQYEHWGWGSDLTVSHEGYSMGRTVNNVYSTMTVNPVYLRMTPKAYYFFGSYGDNIRPKIFLGPSVAYKLDETRYMDGNNVNADDVIVPGTVTSGDVVKDWDLGVNAGAGVNFRILPRTWLNTDVSYYHGLLDVTGTDMMNRNVRVGVGFMFGL